jgi:hypothetical protein
MRPDRPVRDKRSAEPLIAVHARASDRRDKVR